MNKLWNVKLINTGNGQTVYDENITSKDEPTLEEMQGLLRLLRPHSKLKFDLILTEHIGFIHPETFKVI